MDTFQDKVERERDNFFRESGKFYMTGINKLDIREKIQIYKSNIIIRIALYFKFCNLYLKYA